MGRDTFHKPLDSEGSGSGDHSKWAINPMQIQEVPEIKRGLLQEFELPNPIVSPGSRYINICNEYTGYGCSKWHIFEHQSSCDF